MVLHLWCESRPTGGHPTRPTRLCRWAIGKRPLDRRGSDASRHDTAGVMPTVRELRQERLHKAGMARARKMCAIWFSISSFGTMVYARNATQESARAHGID